MNDVEYRYDIYSKSFRKFLHRAFPGHIIRPDSYNVGFAQSRPRTFLAKHASVFVSHIRQIVGLSPKKKVTWIYAFSIVASVADALTFWNCPVVQFIRQSMSVKRFSYPAAFPNRSVSISCGSSIPRPTFVDVPYNNMRPKSFKQIRDFSRHVCNVI